MVVSHSGGSPLPVDQCNLYAFSTVSSTELPDRSVAFARNDTEVASLGCWTTANTFATTGAADQVRPPSNDASTVSVRGRVPVPDACCWNVMGTTSDSPAAAELLASNAGVNRRVEIGSRTGAVPAVCSDRNVHVARTVVDTSDTPLRTPSVDST